MTSDNLLDQTIHNLPFEVVAIYDDGPQVLPQNTNNNLPRSVNVKIRIRNKEDTGAGRHGIISVPKLSARSWPKRVRLVNSAQTIMSFNLALEPNSDEAQKKSNKRLFQMFRPGGCLSIHRDEDVYSYMPSTSTELKRKSASGIEDYESSKITGAFALKKNDFSSTYTNTLKTPKTFLGKCKPGGCLDPPFGEDKYTYKPTDEDAKSLQQPVINTNSVHPGISTFDIKPKSTTQDQQINILRQSFPETKILGKTAKLLTYPSTLSSSKLKTKDSQNTKSNLRMQSEHVELSRQLTSEFPEEYFIPPRKEKPKNGKRYDTYNYEEKEHKIKEAYVNKDYILQSQTPSELLSDALTITSQSFDEPLGGVMKGKQAVGELNSITPLLLKSEGLLNNKKSKENIKSSTTVSAKGIKIDENTFLHDQNSSNHNNIPIVEKIFSNIEECENVLYKHISRSNSSIKINAIQKTAEDNNYKNKKNLNNKLEFEDKHLNKVYSLDLSNEIYTKTSKMLIDPTRISLVNFDVREDNNLLGQHQNGFEYDINKAEITDIRAQIGVLGEENNIINPLKAKKSGSLEYQYDKNISGQVVSHVIIKEDTNSETDHSKPLITEQRRGGDISNNFDKNVNEQMFENISEPVELLFQDLEFKDNDNMEKLVDQGNERTTEQIIDTLPSVESDILPKVASLRSSLHSLNNILSLKNLHSDLISPNDNFVNQNDSLLNKESSKSTELTNEKSKNDSNVNQKDSLLNTKNSKSTELTNEKSKNDSYVNQNDSLLNNESSKSKELTNEKSKSDSYVNQKDSLLINESSKSKELTNEKSKNDSYVNQKDSLLNTKNSKSIELTNEKSKNDSYVNQKDSLLNNESSRSKDLNNEKSKADEHDEKQKSFDSLENTLSSSLITGYTSSQKTEIDKKNPGFSMILESQEIYPEIISKTENLGDTDIILLPKMFQLNDLSPNKIKLDNHNRTESEQAFRIVSKIKTSKDTLESIETVPLLRQGFSDSDSLQHRKSLNYSTSKNDSKNFNIFINDSKMLLPNPNPDINVSKIDILFDDKFRKPTNDLNNGNLRSPQKLSNTIIYQESDIETSEKTSSLKLDNVKELNLVDPTRETKKSFTDSNKKTNSISSIALHFGFHTFANEKNGFSMETFDPSISVASYPQENIYKIKTILRKNDSELKIKIDSETNLTMQIKPIRQLDGSRKLASNILNGYTDDKRKDNIRVYASEILIKKDKLLQETLKAVYETLTPIENNITKLREEADSLYREQLLLKEVLLSKEINPNRIIPNVRTCSCLQREIGLKITEHIHSIKNLDKNGSAITEHILDSGTAHYIRFDKASVLAREKFLVPRKVREAIEISRLPIFNRDSGLVLASAWKPVINKIIQNNYSGHFKSDTVSSVCSQYLTAASDEDLHGTSKDDTTLSLPPPAHSSRRAQRSAARSSRRDSAML